MRAAVFYGNKEIRVEDRAVRPLKPDEILIDVKAAGICGTDIHLYNGFGVLPTASLRLFWGMNLPEWFHRWEAQ